MHAALASAHAAQVKGFVPTELSVATLLFEGTKEEIALQQKTVFEVASRHKGLSGGEGMFCRCRRSD